MHRRRWIRERSSAADSYRGDHTRAGYYGDTKAVYYSSRGATELALGSDAAGQDPDDTGARGAGGGPAGPAKRRPAP
jgi:hypothetical protein